MEKNVFLVMVLEHSKPKKDEDSELLSIVFGPEPVIAKDEMSAAIKVTNKYADLVKSLDPDCVEVLVRPF